MQAEAAGENQPQGSGRRLETVFPCGAFGGLASPSPCGSFPEVLSSSPFPVCLPFNAPAAQLLQAVGPGVRYGRLSDPYGDAAAQLRNS
mmetsp:Transcript_5535/g.11379  ORF Transcript_5535/g.11379 Transcript_5535/m.11379 type:complete len:89 (+) Transcript_5535:140-406(+)